jgi:formylglycine-generating enzyme required for sulfatase activity
MPPRIRAVVWAGVLGCILTATSFSASPGAEPGWTFRDCPTCPEMVVVPEGNFMMGSNEGDFDEKPVHEVTIAKPIAVGKFEVTWEEWETCVAEGTCDNGPVTESGGDNGWGKGRRPVIEVSWHDAQTFVAWLNSKVSGDPYRLLSEAEWEYAARAGTTTTYHWGTEFDASKANDGNKLVPVGQYGPNDFGLHDMHGNALEWVQDCYNDSYEGAPTDGGSVSESPDCQRVLRSGAWSYGPRVLRAADRYEIPPGDRVNILGFRVAKTL